MPAIILAGASLEPKGHVSVEAAAFPGVQRGPGGEDDLPLHRVRLIPFGNLRPGRAADHGDRVHQMVGECRDVELAARRLLREVVIGDPVQHVL